MGTEVNADDTLACESPDEDNVNDLEDSQHDE